MGMGRVMGLPGHTVKSARVARLVGAFPRKAYGLSLQVKTCEKPHERTSDSDWERGGGVMILSIFWVEKRRSQGK